MLAAKGGLSPCHGPGLNDQRLTFKTTLQSARQSAFP